MSEPMRHALGDLRRRPPARRAPLDGLPPPGRAILLRQQEVARVEARPLEHVVAPDREEARGERHDAHLAPLPTRRRRITSAAALVPRRSVTAAGSCVEVDANLLRRFRKLRRGPLTENTPTSVTAEHLLSSHATPRVMGT